jgi:hypothetical protein
MAGCLPAYHGVKISGLAVVEGTGPPGNTICEFSASGEDVSMAEPKLPPLPPDDNFEDHLSSYLPVFSDETREELDKQLAHLAPRKARRAAIQHLEREAAMTLYGSRHLAEKFSSGPVRLALVTDLLKKADQLDKAIRTVAMQQIFPPPRNSSISQPYFRKFKYSIQETQEAIQELAWKYDEFVGLFGPWSNVRDMNPPTGAGRLEFRIGFALEAARTWIRLGGPLSFNLQTRPIAEDKFVDEMPDLVDETVIPDGVTRFARTACHDVFQKAGYEPYSDVALRTLFRRQLRERTTDEDDD